MIITKERVNELLDSLKFEHEEYSQTLRVYNSTASTSDVEDFLEQLFVENKIELGELVALSRELNVFEIEA